MGRDELKSRDVWQDQSGAYATVAEREFYNAFKIALNGTQFQIRPKPKEFNNIYKTVLLDPTVELEIHNPKEGIGRHGISPDYAIDNLKTEKSLYVEVKRQDGWVEGKHRSAGRGNAHERSCKFFTPGLLDVMRQRGKIGEPALPFWTVFLGDITRDPCRVREITLWYKGVQDHFFLWRNSKDPTPLLEHFEKKLKHLLT